MPRPTCPKCKYDLVGLVNKNCMICCPECGTTVSFDQATITISRYPAMMTSFHMLFVAPQVVHLFSFIVYQFWDYDNDALFAFGFVPVGLIFWVLLIATIMRIHKEWSARSDFVQHQIKPRAIVSYLNILSCAILSMIVNTQVVGLWAAAIASV